MKKTGSLLIAFALFLSLFSGFAMQAAVKSKIYGDLNGDGEIGTVDATLLKRYLAQWDVTSQIDLAAADVDGSGDIVSKDSVLLVRYLAGWDLTDHRIGEPISQLVDHPVLPTDEAAISVTSSTTMEKGTTQPLTFDFTAEKKPTSVVYTYVSSHGDIVDVASDGTDNGILTAKAVGVSTVKITAWMYDEKTKETTNVTKSFDVTVVDSGEKLTAGTDYAIRPANDGAKVYADYLKNELIDRGTEMTVSETEAAKEIVLSVGSVNGISVDSLRDEGYIVKVDGEKIYVAAKTAKGLDMGVRYLVKNYATLTGEISIAKTTDVTIASGAHIKNLTIAGNSISDYELVIPDAYTPSINNAAKTFRRYLSRATGAYPEIKIKSEATEGKKRIEFIVDPTAKIEQTEDGQNKISPTGYHVVEEYGDLKRAGYIIEIDESGNVIITGGPNAGNLYGAYEFLEEFVGMRFLDEGIFYYDTDNVNVPANLKHKEIPSNEYRYVAVPDDLSEVAETYLVPRRINATETQKVYSADYGDGIGTMWAHAHSFYLWITEYWEQKDPDRGVITGSDMYLDTQPCLTNEKNLEEFIRKAGAEIKKRNEEWGQTLGDPGMQQLTVGWNDNEHYCNCSGRNGCITVNKLEGSGSGTLVRFVNRVAEWLETAYPQMQVYTIAYGTKIRKPTNTALKDNVVLCYCWNGCNNHLFDGSQCSAAGTAGMYHFQNKVDSDYYQGWTEKASTIYTWYYSTNYFAYLAPMPNTYNIHYDAFWLAENGNDGFYAESQDGRDCKGLEKAHSYLLSNVMWNPYMSVENYQSLIEEYYRMTYGDGWKYMLEYMDMWIEAGDQLKCWTSNYSQPQEILSVRYYAENYDTMRELFDKAEAMANNSTQQTLIRMARCHVDFLSLAGDYEAKYVNGSDEEKAAYKAKYEEFYYYLKNNNIPTGGGNFPETAEITANPLYMFYGISSIDPR